MPDCRRSAVCLSAPRQRAAPATLVADRRCRRAACLLVPAALWAGATPAAQFDITGPPGSAVFGKHVAVLPNGNIVVTDPTGVASQVGAAYLYDPGGSLIDAITGGAANDHVGGGGIVVLKSGNFLILSPDWSNGAAGSAGAVTFGNAVTGFNGSVVSPANSLVGSSAFDQIGYNTFGAVTALANGHYVIATPNWDNLSTAASDAGMAAWGNGTSGTTGAISAANALVGTRNNDRIGGYGVRELANGHYVVSSPGWSPTDAGEHVGAVTWGNGGGGTAGTISATNSLVGSTANDFVGNNGVTALSNGHYVVGTQCWPNGAIQCAGAVTWCNGNGSTVGAVSAANSLVGDHYDDRVGFVRPLSNGNYLVTSSKWDNGGATDAGAATWGNGNGGTAGTISAANSLVGTSANDAVGFNVGVLPNGNYAVPTMSWHNGANVAVGAVTWGNGASGTTGPVSPANSLVGSSANDLLNVRVIVLSNGNYVVTAPNWDNGGATDAGAATWRPGNAAAPATISAANSLVGSAADDHVGLYSSIALTNGNYAIQSPDWNNGGIANAGAVTWGNGNGGTVGTLSAANSLVGSTTDDNVGTSVVSLGNGHYAVASPNWNGFANDSGAVTWGRGTGGTVGAIAGGNSLLGNSVNDKLGMNGAVAVGNGNYVVRSAWFDSLSFNYIGAIGLVRGFAPSNRPGMAEFVTGGVDTGLDTTGFAYDAARDTFVVGRPGVNKVTIVKLDLIFRDGLE